MNVGLKQHSNNDDWLELWDKCLDIVSEKRLQYLTEKAIRDIEKVTAKYDKVAYGWSGGKDSIVLNDLILKSGVNVFGNIY